MLNVRPTVWGVLGAAGVCMGVACAHQGLTTGGPAIPERAADVDRATATRFVPIAESALPLPGGVYIAHYALPDAGGSEHALDLWLAYDTKSGASAQARSWDGEFFVTDVEGTAWRGALDAPGEAKALREDLFPLDDSQVEAFFPMVILRDLAARPEQFLTVESVPVEGGGADGVAVTIAEPHAKRFGDRLDLNRVDVPRAPVTYSFDAQGRPMAVAIPGSRRAFSYAPDGPEGFPLADPAHGGKWRLVRWEHRAEADARVFMTPQVVAATAQAWGIRPEGR